MGLSGIFATQGGIVATVHGRALSRVAEVNSKASWMREFACGNFCTGCHFSVICSCAPDRNRTNRVQSDSPMRSFTRTEAENFLPRRDSARKFFRSREIKFSFAVSCATIRSPLADLPCRRRISSPVRRTSRSLSDWFSHPQPCRGFC